ncbi:MAG: hypothetical protein VW552_03470 [Ilumatobacter sp.]|jgi:hypothetical protein|nr:hypothetical protein [Actinomycetota bacterium]
MALVSVDPVVRQRRRFAMALALTVVAVPAAVLLDREDDPGGVTSVATSVPVDAAPDAAAEIETDDPLGVPVPAHLERRVTIAPPEGAFIAIPSDDGTYTGLASFTYESPEEDLCFARGAEIGRYVTITNIENNRSVSCIVTLVDRAGFQEVELHPIAFSKIADPTDAPIRVEYRW